MWQAWQRDGYVPIVLLVIHESLIGWEMKGRDLRWRCVNSESIIELCGTEGECRLPDLTFVFAIWPWRNFQMEILIIGEGSKAATFIYLLSLSHPELFVYLITLPQYWTKGFLAAFQTFHLRQMLIIVWKWKTRRIWPLEDNEKREKVSWRQTFWPDLFISNRNLIIMLIPLLNPSMQPPWYRTHTLITSLYARISN